MAAMETTHSREIKVQRGWYARMESKDHLTIFGTGQITIRIDSFDPHRTKVSGIQKGLFDEDMGPMIKRVRYPIRKGLALEVHLYETNGDDNQCEAELVVGPLSIKLPADEAGLLVAVLQGFPPVPRPGNS